MMGSVARSLSYADAARILGGQDSKVVTALEKTAGWLMAGTAPFARDLLEWFDYKADLIRLSHDLVRDLSERKSGLSRYDRTERLEAALTVIAVASFFEALDDTVLPFPFTRLKPVKAEELALAGAGGVLPASGLTWMVEALKVIGDWQPDPQQAHEEFLDVLLEEYRALATEMERFVTGLAAWETLPDEARARFSAVLRATPESACRRYEEAFRRLVVEFPEVACWANQREHRSTRAALGDLEEMLEAISSGRAPDARRQSLATANRAELDRRVAESGDVPDGIRMPSLGEAYVPPRFRAGYVPSAVQVSDESWWAQVPVRDDLQDYLVGHLTSPQAVRAPLLVLGQPGSGKSVLTRVLAARLPAADFMPLRVILRDVPAADDLQDQIEHAIRRATGERVDWPALARSADGALPVIMLDGFDELLQAVGVSQTDYLVKVARFQQREAEQGRPVAVLVTSRTAVADRARLPTHTVAVRLEPFDADRVTTWLDIWNSHNAANFAASGLRPLPATTALAHDVLAEQPLLLLMLALYDADGNALQKSREDLSAHELYEQLLRSFAAREITKHEPGLSDRELRNAVEAELRRLSVVAFAMFNRAAQWVTETDLGADLSALPFGSPARHRPGVDLRIPLPAAELTLGRFFFIHQTRASGSGTRMQTYEFLHATFAEYLVARLTWQVARDVAAKQSVSTMSFDSAPADDDLLRALLSYQPLSLRSPVIESLAAMARARPAEERAELRAVLLSLFRMVNHLPPIQRYAAYRPQSITEPARYSAYAANILLLALCTGDIRGEDLYPEAPDPVTQWHAQTLLWRSQLSQDGYTSLVNAVGVERKWAGDQRVIEIELGATLRDSLDSLSWTLGSRPQATGIVEPVDAITAHQIWRQTSFQCGTAEDILLHALAPLTEKLSWTISVAAGSADGRLQSAANLLVQTWARPSPRGYLLAVDSAETALQAGSKHFFEFGRIILDRLASDMTVGPAEAADVLTALSRHRDQDVAAFDDTLVRCALTRLGRDRITDERLVRVIGAVLGDSFLNVDPVVAVDAMVRAFELGLHSLVPDPLPLVDRKYRAQLLTLVTRVRPDLGPRFARLAEEFRR